MDAPDNYDAWEAHEAKQQEELDKRPRCSECDAPIQSDFCYEINDELICEDCMKDNHKKSVDDFIY